MKLEHLFSEAIRKREGIQTDVSTIESLLSATLEGHLGIPARDLKGPFSNNSGILQFEKYAFLEEGITNEALRLLRRDKKAAHPFQGNDKLTEEQKQAVEAILSENFVVLTGGPGTGKTFTIAQCIRSFTGKRIVVAAPTGKAAAHLQAGIESVLDGEKEVLSGTIHSMLGVRDSYDAVNKDLFLGADLIVVDECSMIDVSMWYALLRAVSNDSKLLLVGDTDQLPPVETGSIFYHLCAYLKAHFPKQCVHLSKCLRSDSLEIVSLAQAINTGKEEEALSILAHGEHVGFTTEIVFPPFPKDASPEELLMHAKKYRILSALKEGEYGVHALNARFSYKYSRGELWVEPIIITKSSRELGLFNGENGIALRFRDEKEKDIAYFPSKGASFRSLPLSLLPRYELSYALSIHKSQGSEYDHVTIVLQKGASSFGRELLYTGITRAKKSVHIYGGEKVLIDCMEKRTLRSSTLNERLESLER